MSRAFVRESDVPQLPELPPPVSPLPPGAKNCLTPAGAAQLARELQQRLEHERPRLATAPGDDLDAKRELPALARRIRHLPQALRTAEIVPPPPAAERDTVRFGAFVTVTEPGGGTTRYRIVGLDETDPARDRISYLSPLARALLQARRGDRVAFQSPRGARELMILAIDYED